MKYIYLACIKTKNWKRMSETEREAYRNECFATIVRVQKDQVSITDGPFAETKEQMG